LVQREVILKSTIFYVKSINMAMERNFEVMPLNFKVGGIHINVRKYITKQFNY